MCIEQRCVSSFRGGSCSTILGSIWTSFSLAQPTRLKGTVVILMSSPSHPMVRFEPLHLEAALFVPPLPGTVLHGFLRQDPAVASPSPSTHRVSGPRAPRECPLPPPTGKPRKARHDKQAMTTGHGYGARGVENQMPQASMKPRDRVTLRLHSATYMWKSR